MYGKRLVGLKKKKKMPWMWKGQVERITLSLVVANLIEQNKFLWLFYVF